MKTFHKNFKMDNGNGYLPIHLIITAENIFTLIDSKLCRYLNLQGFENQVSKEGSENFFLKYNVREQEYKEQAVNEKSFICIIAAARNKKAAEKLSAVYFTHFLPEALQIQKTLDQ